MSTQIYYFSGTGNSFHIAKELQGRMPGTMLISMVGAVRSGQMEATAVTVGFVFPIHCLCVPFFVKRFLRKVNLESASYLFAITSRECSAKVFSEADQVLSKQNRRLDACFSVQMPETYLPVFEVDSEDEIRRKEAVMLRELDFIESVITSHKKFRKPDPREIGMYIYYIIRPVLVFIYHKTRYFNLENRFYADEKCTGCGLCRDICPSERIDIREGKPVWDRNTDCIFCFACIHYCPAHAIQIKRSKTAVRGRYHHPDVRAGEIIHQKASPGH